MIVRACALNLIIIIKLVVWTISDCLGLGHETMEYTVCLAMFIWNVSLLVEDIRTTARIIETPLPTLNLVVIWDPFYFY